MQQTSFMDRTVTLAAAAKVWPHTDYLLNLALVYEDSLTWLWAMRVRELVARVVGKEAVRCTEWKISDLREPRVYTEGAAALARADVIVISVYEAERFPPEFYMWVNLWLLQRCRLSGALVALMSTTGELCPAYYETRSYLRALASQGHFELFFKEGNRGSELTSIPREELIQWAKAA